jgi:hypothetical protein
MVFAHQGLENWLVRKIEPYLLWLGHVGHVRDLRGVFTAGVAALVDLAMNEPPATITRELVYCRFPLADGSGNAPWLLHAAIDATAGLLRSGTPTLVFCSNGMSRTPAIAAAAIAKLTNRSPDVSC